jgi:hypothetical protein
MSDQQSDTSHAEENGQPRSGPISATTVSDISLDMLARTFAASARRWEIVVYPFIVAFAVLASFGFYLIYNMVSDVHRVTGQMVTIERTMVAVSENMARVTENMAVMTTNMVAVTANMNTITQEVVHMRKSFDEAIAIAARMDQKMAVMLPIAHRMQVDADIMTQRMHSMTRPMNFMTSFVPMGN